MQIAMAAVKQSPDNFLRISDRKTRMMSKAAAFEEFETYRESCGSSSSEDLENYSPKSVVSKVRRWPSAMAKDVGNVGVFGRCRVHSQIVRIRSEDSHLGEDIGECLIARVSGSGDHELVDDIVFSRSASPLSGRVSSK